MAPLLLMVALTSAARPFGPSEPSEAEIKAVLIYKFAKFVTWPEDRFEDRESPVVFGVLGETPIAKALETTLEGRTIQGRSCLVRRFENVEELGYSHALFISRPISEELAPVLKAIGDSPTLLVGDRAYFAHEGGMINFYHRGGSIRFEIHPQAAKGTGLTIDAKLLQLARIISD